MISMIYAESEICMVTIVFYTCVVIPLRRMKEALFRLLDEDASNSCLVVEASSSALGLGASRFEEVGKCGGSSSRSMCSICLMEYERGDVVCELQGCRHVFHRDCIHQWLHRHNVTCLLCRSPLA